MPAPGGYGTGAITRVIKQSMGSGSILAAPAPTGTPRAMINDGLRAPGLVREAPTRHGIKGAAPG